MSDAPSVTIPLGTLEEAERALIAATLQATAGDKTQAAARLGICRSALYAKIDRLGLEACVQKRWKQPPPLPASGQPQGGTP